MSTINKLSKAVKIGIYLAMLLPLVFTSRTMYPWHFGKTVLFQALIEILLVLALIYLSFNSKKIFKFNWLDWLVLGFVVLQIISAVFGVNFMRSFWGNQQRAQGIFTWLHFTASYFLLRQFFITKKDWQNLGIWLLVISFISCLIAWFGKYFAFLENVISQSSQLSGMIGNPIFFASYLIIPVFLGFVCFFILDKNNKWRWFGLLAGLFGLITLLFTQVRGAFVGLTVGLVAIWTMQILFSRSLKTKRILISIGILFLILISSTYIFNQKSDYLQKNLPVISRLLNITPYETTASTRLMAWQIALKGWQDRPVFGWGPENFQDAFDKHYNPEFLRYSFAETVWDKPHSYPLEVLSTMGLLGFICYLAIVVMLLAYLMRIIKRQDNENRRLAFIILVGAVVAYVVQSSFAFETSNSLLIWMTVIAFISFCYTLSKNKANGYTSEFLHKSVAWIAIIIIIITPYLLYKNYTFYKASVYMGDTRDAADIGSNYLWQKNAPQVLAAEVPFLWEQAIFLTKDLSNFDSYGKLDKKTLETAAPQLVEIFEQEIKNNPQSYLLRFWASQLYCLMGEYIDNKYYNRSNQLLEEAWQFSPERQHIPLLLAKNYLLQDKTAEAIEILEQLVKKNPQFKEPHWFLGLALVKNGQEDRGMEELEKGKSFGISFKNNILYLIDLYARRKEYKKIIPLYEKLINDEPDKASYYASLAATYAAIGDEENVIINLNKAVELNPALTEEAKLFLEQQGIDISKYK